MKRMFWGIPMLFCLVSLAQAEQQSCGIDRKEEAAAADRAKKFERDGAFLSAAREYEKAVLARPDNVYYYLSCGRMYDRAERPDLGLKIMQNALQNFPQNPRVHSGLSRMEYRMGQFDNALLHVSTALSHVDQIEKPYLLSLKGQILREMKRFELSETAFVESLRLKEDAWVFYEYGKLLMDKKDYPRAVWAIRKARSFGVRLEGRAKETIERKYASALYEDAVRLMEKGEKAKAKERFSQILRLKPEWVSAYAEKASFWIKRL